MRHHRDESFLALSNAILQSVRKETEVIGADVAVAVVVHREIGEQSNGLAFGRLYRDELEHGVLRPSFADRFVPITACMHVGANGGIAEGIFTHIIGVEHPAAKGRVFSCIDFPPANLRRFHVLERGENGVDQLLGEKKHVGRIGVGSERSHTGRGAVRVGGGNENVLWLDLGLRGGESFGLVIQITGDHAAIDDHEHDGFFSIGKGERASVHRGFHRINAPAHHASVDEHGEFFWRHVGNR